MYLIYLMYLIYIPDFNAVEQINNEKEKMFFLKIEN